MLGESHVRRSLAVYSPWGCKELDMTERLSNLALVGRFLTTGSSRKPPRSAGFNTEKPENSGFLGVRAKTEGGTEKQKKKICQGTKTDRDLGKISPTVLPLSYFIHLKILIKDKKSYSSPQGIFETQKIIKAANFLRNIWG